MMPQCQEVRFVDVVLAWKSCPQLRSTFNAVVSASKLPQGYSRFDAPVLSVLHDFFAVVLVSLFTFWPLFEVMPQC